MLFSQEHSVTCYDFPYPHLEMSRVTVSGLMLYTWIVYASAKWSIGSSSKWTHFIYLFKGNAEEWHTDEVPGDRKPLGWHIPIPVFTAQGSNLSESAWRSLSEASVEDRHSQLPQFMHSQRDVFDHGLFESSTAPSQDVGVVLACLYVGSFTFTGWSPSSLPGPHHKKDDFVTLYPK